MQLIACDAPVQAARCLYTATSASGRKHRPCSAGTAASWAACQPACSFAIHVHAQMKTVAKLIPFVLLTDGMDADWLSAAKLTLGPTELLDGWPAVAGAVTAGVLSAAVVPAGKTASLPGVGLAVSPEARALLGALVTPDTAAMPSLRVTVRANGRRSRVSRR